MASLFKRDIIQAQTKTHKDMKKSLEMIVAAIGTFAIGTTMTTAVRADSQVNTKLERFQTLNNKEVESTSEQLQEQKLVPILSPYAKITLAQAKQAALREVDGEIKQANIDVNKNRSLYYEVEMKTQVVYVDAGNGQILGVETAEQESIEAHIQSSLKLPDSVKVVFEN